MIFAICSAAYLLVGCVCVGMANSDPGDEWVTLLFWPFVLAVALGIAVRGWRIGR